jgi:lipoate-protein ligase A
VAEAVENGASPNTLIMLQPGAPYAYIGYHQDIEKELDLEYCRSAGLPVIRRSQCGGATFLDGGQVFYQIVAKKTNSYPTAVDAMFKKLITITIETYHRFGVPAEFKPLNDVVARGKKLSGNGASMNGSTSIMRALRGKRLEEETLRAIVNRFYDVEKPEMSGVGPEDIVQALLKVKALL